ncbi:MAG TPA: M48 family metallopeptidase [Pseudobdellovibrionaceae bacterium]|nr:M48 family metallopeptidase [Pseudobdellovibrionaceae bacterium]
MQVDFDLYKVSFRFFDGEKTEYIEWAYRDLVWEMGGNRNSLLFLGTKENPDRLYFEIETPLIQEIKKHEGLKDIWQEVSRDRKKSSRSALIWATSIISVLTLLIVFRGPIFGSLGSAIPFSWEKNIADQVLNPKITTEQQTLVKKLDHLIKKLKVDPEWTDQLTFHISSNTEPNAYATLGGHVFVNKGLITELKSSEQLIGVIAHEMAHVHRRHVVRSLSQALGVFSVFQLLIGDISGLAAILIDQGGPLLNLQYSRELEEQADSDALMQMIESQIDPIGLSQSLQIIRDQQQRLISQSPGSEALNQLQKIEILNSHPDIEKRIQSLTDRAQQLKQESLKQGRSISPIEFDYEKFKNEIKERF